MISSSSHRATMTTIAAILIFLFPAKAHAYLDPGTGSLMIQVLIGFFIAALVFLKIYWAKVKVFFRKIFSRHERKDGSKG